MAKGFWEKTTSHKSMAIGMILIAAFSRLLPHWPNFTAVGAMALFAGSILGFRISSILIPILTLFVTDLIFGFHSTMIVVYGATILNVALGAFLLRERSGKKILAVSLLSSVCFFLITNFGVWALDGMYAKNLSGILLSYTMALPFFPNQIAGDLFFTGILFGLFALYQKRQIPVKN